jgi:type III secretory pathway component EscR
MDDQLLQTILSIVGSVFILVNTVFVPMYLKNKANAQKAKEVLRKMDTINEYARTAVQAAEQFMAQKTNEEKFAWVSQQLLDRYTDLTDEQVKTIVESAIFNMKQFYGAIQASSTVE